MTKYASNLASRETRTQSLPERRITFIVRYESIEALPEALAKLIDTADSAQVAILSTLQDRTQGESLSDTRRHGFGVFATHVTRHDKPNHVDISDRRQAVELKIKPIADDHNSLQLSAQLKDVSDSYGRQRVVVRAVAAHDDQPEHVHVSVIRLAEVSKAAAPIGRLEQEALSAEDLAVISDITTGIVRLTRHYVPDFNVEPTTHFSRAALDQRVMAVASDHTVIPQQAGGART